MTMIRHRRVDPRRKPRQGGGTKKKGVNSQVNPLSNSPGRESRSNREVRLAASATTTAAPLDESPPPSSTPPMISEEVKPTVNQRGEPSMEHYETLTFKQIVHLVYTSTEAIGQVTRREMTNETPSLTDEKMTDESTTPSTLSAPTPLDPLDNDLPRNASTTNTTMMTMKATTLWSTAPNARWNSSITSGKMRRRTRP